MSQASGSIADSLSLLNAAVANLCADAADDRPTSVVAHGAERAATAAAAAVAAAADTCTSTSVSDDGEARNNDNNAPDVDDDVDVDGLSTDILSENYWLRERLREIQSDRDRLVCEVANLRLELDMGELKRLPENG